MLLLAAHLEKHVAAVSLTQHRLGLIVRRRGKSTRQIFRPNATLGLSSRLDFPGCGYSFSPHARRFLLLHVDISIWFLCQIHQKMIVLTILNFFFCSLQKYIVDNLQLIFLVQFSRKLLFQLYIFFFQIHLKIASMYKMCTILYTVVFVFRLNGCQIPPDRIIDKIRDHNFVCLITLITTIKVNPLRDIYIFSILK